MTSQTWYVHRAGLRRSALYEQWDWHGFCICYPYPGLRSRSFLGGVGVPTTLEVGFFCPIPNVQFDHFLHYTPKLGIPVAMVQFLLKRLLQQISCCAPRFPLILAAKFHSLDVKESDSEILKWSETDILPPTPQPCPCQQETHLSLFQTKSSRDNV